ncbi:glycosyltransferase family 2 protein [Paucilactobacillus suebicus]|uniref:dTDP-rhamnosyl transferase RfbF n=1 Tax=Paucilactobacillus suebicus DSM 5007 = KCTC 3549 TaxID=1423807 RepID=A0A0R1W764_9LACO|nr:glycosyltransferase family 2 protein [Paucilactobacillus suebicus]KRM13269.1 dTDP-rhamnosyl transferase RfbF [Paucilactobacillus suebicus DSM 5007 = KCTC 3549]
MNTVAVVVTNNRLALLKECLKAIKNQSYKLDAIVVVDNNSSDGTKEYLSALSDSVIKPVFLSENLGGAGGFNRGFKEAMKLNADHLWIMDDDTIPDEDALKELVKATSTLDGDYGFLSSYVYWKDGTPANMNRPTLDSENWLNNIDSNLFKIVDGTFVSMLVSADAVKEFGYPIKDFFIWGDDVNFARRVSEAFNCYFVPSSRVLHKCNSNKFTDIVRDDVNRIPRYYYEYRNRLYNYRQFWGWRGLIKYFNTVFKGIIRILLKSDHKILRLKYLVMGFSAAIVFHPVIEEYDLEQNGRKSNNVF